MNDLDQFVKDSEDLIFSLVYHNTNYKHVKLGKPLKDEPNMYLLDKKLHYISDQKLKLVLELVNEEKRLNDILETNKEYRDYYFSFKHKQLLQRIKKYKQLIKEQDE